MVYRSSGAKRKRAAGNLIYLSVLTWTEALDSITRQRRVIETLIEHSRCA
jgi:hypothetical protein